MDFGIFALVVYDEPRRHGLETSNRRFVSCRSGFPMEIITNKFL